jgi:hypothetical protein
MPSRKRAHGQRCPYCDRTMQLGHPRLNPTRDHFVPQSQGGTGADIIMACLQCNNIKGDMMPEQWTRFMEGFPKWWTLPRTALNRARSTVNTPGIQHRAPSTTRPRPKLKSKRAPVVVPAELIWKTKAQDALLRAVKTAFPAPTEPRGAISQPEAPDAPAASVSEPAGHPRDLL